MKYLRRLVWFIASRLLVITVVLGMMVTVFYYAMNLANIYVVVKDGMALRAQAVMGIEDESGLTKYFQQSFLEKDSVLTALRSGNSPYADYNVRGIDHRVSIDFFWVWPWEKSVGIKITERIPRIDGRAKGSTAESLVAKGGASALYPPRWTSGRYKVILAHENGQWLIRSLTLTNEAVD